MVEIRTASGYGIDHEKLAEKIASKSLFSKRQAEVYLLRNRGGLSVEKTASELEISPGTVSDYSDRYREKIQKAEATLNIRDEWS